jgi:tetratricopeptide (TPR) repeat protein
MPERSSTPAPKDPEEPGQAISDSRAARDIIQMSNVSGQFHFGGGDHAGVPGLESIVPRQLDHPVRGRKALVSALLGAPGTTRVLCGLGGAGKTTVALAAAHQARTKGVDVWWVTASDEAQLNDGMRALADNLGADRDRMRDAWSGEGGHAPDLVWELLALRTGPWLLVIDNADDVRLLAVDGRVSAGVGWVRPPPEQGRVLITSRIHEASVWGSWVRVTAIDDLPTEQAAAMLRDRAGNAAGTDDEAAALAARLGSLPVWLHQAGLYLARARRRAPWSGEPRYPRTFEEYRVAVDDRLAELVEKPVPGPTPTSPREQLDGVWEMTLDLLADEGLPHARSLLYLFAHFADAPIPYAVVLSPDALAESPVFRLEAHDDLQQGVDALANTGLLTKQTPDDGQDDSSHTVTLHPTVSEVIRALPGVRTHRSEYLRLAASGLASGLNEPAGPRDPIEPRHQTFFQAASFHLSRLGTLAPTLPDATVTPIAEALTTTAVACVKAAISGGQDGLAEVVVSQIMPLTVHLHPDHRAALDLRFEHARVKARRQTLAEAEAEYRAVLAEFQRVCGQDSPDALATWSNVALMIRLDERLGEAEAEYRDLLAVHQRKSGPTHSDTLRIRQDIADILRTRGQLDQAEAEYRTLLAIRQRKSGPTHSDTLDIRRGIANVLHNRGQLDQAEVEYRAILSAKRMMAGQDNSTLLGARWDVAWILSERQQLTNAEAEYREILAEWLRVKGPDHNDTLTLRKRLTDVLERQGRLPEAEAEYRSLYTDQTRILGENHATTMATRHALADVLVERGQFLAAVTEYRAMLANRTRIHGDDHPDTLYTRHSLAWALAEQGRLVEAETEYKAVITDRTRILGEDHPDTLAARGGYASNLTEQGRFAEAEMEYRTLLADRTRLLGENHPSVLATRHSLAWTLAEHGRLAEAETEYRTLLADRTRLLGEEHPSVLATRHSLAWTLAEHGQFAEAETEYRAVITDRTRILGQNHPDTLQTRFSRAWMLGENSRFNHSNAEFHAVIADRSRILGDTHPDTLNARHGLAWLLSQNGRFAEADAEFRAVLADRARILGDLHPHTLVTRHRIAESYSRQERLEEAETELRAVLGDRIQVLGERHPHTLATRHLLAEVHGRLGRLAEAKAELRAVLSDRIQVLGETHPDTVRTKESLAALR